MWEIVSAGGWMMGPIILFSVIAVAIILERLWTLKDRRVLPPDEFRTWLGAFLPDVPLRPVYSTDPTDGKLAHANGLNLSRAWMLRNLGYGELAEKHFEEGLTAVTGEHYEGGHWLATFAVYGLT